jgi:DNA-binding beta-propeller fold protein YncE
VKVGNNPYGVAVNPNTNMVYVLDHATHRVWIINGTTNMVVYYLKVDRCPFDVSVDLKHNKIYVVNECSGTISLVEQTRNAVTRLNAPLLENSPKGVAVNEQNSLVYVTDIDSNTVLVTNGTRISGNPLQ